MTYDIPRRQFMLGTTALLLASRASATPSSAPVRVEDYDALTDEQLGVSNHVARIATQPTGEWYGMGISSYQGGDEGYRWQIGWWLQPLAITQYRLPAYRELYKSAFEGFVEKMAHRDTWYYWEAQSTGMTMNDSLGVPGRDLPTADPIARDNINYSANTMSLMTMHQMLYRDGRYLQPHSFLLKHWTRDGLEVFSYDLPKVAQALWRGFEETQWKGVACEVNGIYPAYCNQLALVAFKQYDQVQPGGIGASLIANHTRFWQENSDLYKMGAHAPDADEPYIPRAYYVKQDAMVAMGDTMMTSAAYVNGWNHAWVRENYPYWKKRFLVEDGVITVKLDAQVRGHLDHHAYGGGREEDPRPDWMKPGQAERGETPPFYYYAALSAAEMGDSEFLNAIRTHCETFGNVPVWKNGEYFYAPNELSGPARVSRGGAVLLTAAKLVQRDSFYTLYNDPLTEEDRCAPQLEDVDWPHTLVRRAVYDKSRRALIFTLLTAEALGKVPAPARRIDFAIANLDPSRSYSISRDGEKIAHFQSGEVLGSADMLKWSDGRLLVSAVIGGDTSFVIQAV